MINDIFGHSTGDEIIKLIYSETIAMLSDGEFIARTNGDHFIMFMNFVDESSLLKRIQVHWDSFLLKSHNQFGNYNLKFAVGIYAHIDNQLDISLLIDRATIAQKCVKAESGNGIQLFSNEMRESLLAEKEIENSMESSLVKNEFKVYLQPKYDLETGKLAGAEALIRWQKNGKLLAPDKFIPLFEKNEFIKKIDSFVLEEICRQQQIWKNQDKILVPISINQSKLLIYSTNYVSHLLSVAKKYEIDESLIELELTETILHDNIDELLRIISELQKYGFKISIDDFGSGYSSLSMLKDVPADILKIDREFLKKYDQNDRGNIVLTDIVALAKHLSMVVVTEGVESEEQANFLRKLGCNIAQGYYFAKPMPINEFEKLLCKSPHQ